MNKKSNVSWVKPAEPSFLKKFKSDVGFKEGPTIDTKRQEMPVLDDDSGSDREDELPQVVVLKKGDLDADEVKKIKEGTRGAEKEEEPPADGKIVFKKPTKSFSEKFQGITASSSKKRRSEGEREGGGEKKGKSDGDGEGGGEKKGKSDVDGEGGGEKKEKSDGGGEKKGKSARDGEKKEKSGKKRKNNSLLSFGNEEEEED